MNILKKIKVKFMLFLEKIGLIEIKLEGLPKSFKSKTCHWCGVELNKDNTSMWERFAEIGGVVYSVPSCLDCENLDFEGGQKG